MTPLPNFLLIGAAKAGTTALFATLDQHPDVYFAGNKEPRYFAWMEQSLDVRGPGDWAALSPYVVTRWADYARLFANAGTATAIGEASTAYLYHPYAAARIAHALPDARLIAILRHPADRAYAAYLHLLRDGRETLDFAAALRAEPERIAQGWEPLWHYRQMGAYAAQLRRYLAHFERARLHVCLYDDFQADPTATARRIFAFLGVEDSFTPALPHRTNVGGVPRGEPLYRLLAAARWKRARQRIPPGLRHRYRRLLNAWPLRRPPLPPQLRANLTATFRDDILHLQDLLQRDLSAWLG